MSNVELLKRRFTGKETRRFRENMQIFVDADACPVVGIVEAIAEN